MAEADSTASTVNNGVNVEALIAAREALTNAPQAAQFKWRAACEWKNGTHSHSTVEGFTASARNSTARRTFTFDADHPEVFASEDQGRDARRIRAGRAGELPHRRHRRGRPAPQHPAALGHGDDRRRHGPPGHPRHRQRRAQRLRRHQGDLRDRRRRETRGHRGSGGAIAEALGGLRHRDQPDQRHGRGELSRRRRPRSPSGGEDPIRAVTTVDHRCRARRPRHEPLPRGALDRSRGAGARRGRP